MPTLSRRIFTLSVTAVFALALIVPLLAAGPPDEALRQAARTGDMAGVKAAIENGAQLEAGDRYQARALYLAARGGHLNVVRYLLELGADVNRRESFYDSRPLDSALGKGHLEVAKLLLTFGAESREGALAFAVRGENLDLARAVVESGPINDATLRRLRAQTEDAAMKELLERARSRPDPPAPKLEPTVLDQLAGRYEGWSSDTSAEVTRNGNELRMSVNGGDAIRLVVIEHGIGGMAETAFKNTDGTIEATFWGRAGSIEGIYLTREGEPTEMLRRSVAEPVASLPRGQSAKTSGPLRQTVNWPGFRGYDGDGNGDGADAPVSWNVETGANVRFKIELPGLGNSSPVVWGDRVFVTTVIADGVDQRIRVGDTGSGETIDEISEHSWQVLAFDKRTGKQLWVTEVGRGEPLTGRHFKATQANSTPITDGKHLVVVFPTAGLACLDFDGKIMWHHELGGLNASAFTDPDLTWGFSSSPIIYDGTVILQADVSKGSVDEGAYLAAWRVETGEPLWKVSRAVAPSFSTPSVLRGSKGDELVVNGSTIHGYDPRTGEELWSIDPNSELVIARPVVGDDLVYVSAGYAPVKPIYAVRAGNRGRLDVTPGQEHECLAWSHGIGGAYMPTPLLYHGLLYVVHHNGRLVAYDAASGKAYYKIRFSKGGTFTGSPVAVNGRIYIPTEEGRMYVVAAGQEYQELAINEFDEPLMATPAVSEGTLYVRTPNHLYAISER